MKKRRTLGYVPLFNKWSRPLTSRITDVGEFDPNKVSMFKRFIADCKNADVNVIIVLSPNYRKIECQMKFIGLVESLAKQNDIPFWDYLNTEFFLSNSKYFADMVHLNDEGAKIFSEMIAERIIKSNIK